VSFLQSAVCFSIAIFLIAVSACIYCAGSCFFVNMRHGGNAMNTLLSLPVPLQTVLLLVASNVFMTFAWYGHLKNLATSPWYVAALVSWGIALFEYLLQVPANRIGFTQFDVGQLKIIQEVITLSVFVPFAVFYLGQPLKWDYLWAGLCMVGAVYFVFRSA
jgi:uncharacterized protein (DUF486 family)